MYALEEIKMIEVKNDVLNSREIEQIWCVIHYGGDKILVGYMYPPPSSCLIDPYATNNTLSDSLREVRLVSKSLGCLCILVFGDFNYPIDFGGGTATQAHALEPSSISDESFNETLEENHLTQMATFQTILDTDQVEVKNTLDLDFPFRRISGEFEKKITFFDSSEEFHRIRPKL